MKRFEQRNVYRSHAFVATFSIILGAAVMYVYLQYGNTPFIPAGIQAVRESSIRYGTPATLTDPLITVTPTLQNSPHFAGIQSTVQKYIDHQKNMGLLSAAVHFRDINTVEGFVVNPTEKYYPASLYKVFLMITYFKLAEDDPTILNKEIYYSGARDGDAREEIRSAVQLSHGTTYTTLQLIQHMIRYSDNNALRLLTDNLTDAQSHIYLQVFGDLNVDPSTVDQQTDSLTVGGYATVLAALYNASYLDRSYSERALTLMTESDFTAGIESGVPNGVIVAEKFGEAQIETNHAIVGKQLSNCGIVYYPSHPYRLCIMTKGDGNHIKFLEGVIEDISRLIYQDMEIRYPKSEAVK